MVVFQDTRGGNARFKLEQLLLSVGTLLRLLVEAGLLDCFVLHWGLAIGPASLVEAILRTFDRKIADHDLGLGYWRLHLWIGQEFASWRADSEVRGLHDALMVLDCGLGLSVD